MAAANHNSNKSMASAHESVSNAPDQSDKVTELGSVEALELINSLDFAASSPMATDENTKDSTVQQVVESLGDSNRPSGKSRKSKSSGQRQAKRRRQAPSGTQTFANLMLNLIGQLEKVDVKRLVADAMRPSISTRQSPPASSLSRHLQPAGAAQSTTGSARAPTSATGGATSSPPVNSTSSFSSASSSSSASNGKTRERVNASAIAADSGNLLSITSQLVKLARTNLMGAEFGGPPGSAWLSAPMLAMPSMLAAASHMLHDSGSDFTGASVKSDWIWMVAPAVIVIGAGVIIVPLIAAWLVSHAMAQNSFTVTAGRRRKRQAADGHLGDLGADLYRMLDLHKLADVAPELLVEKLSRFHLALERVAQSLAAPPKPSDRGRRARH